MFPIDEFISPFVTIDNNVSNNVNGVDEDKIKTRERLRHYRRTKTDIISFKVKVFPISVGLLEMT